MDVESGRAEKKRGKEGKESQRNVRRARRGLREKRKVRTSSPFGSHDSLEIGDVLSIVGTEEGDSLNIVRAEGDSSRRKRSSGLTFVVGPTFPSSRGFERRESS